MIGKVGLEAELFPFWLGRGGAPAARLALVELIAVVDEITDSARRPDEQGGRPSWTLDGTLITEEPGAQLEVAGPPDSDVDTALDRLERVIERLDHTFADAGAGLAATGLDLWSDPDQVPVQLDIPRYDAMTTYFNRRGGRHGHLLMCASSSLQINVDLGPPDVAGERWLLANLMSPVLIAAFAASPDGDAVNGRAEGWRGLDPTRTGVPPALVKGIDDPLDDALGDAWRADVMFYLRDGEARPGHPGWNFGDWVTRPPDDLGPPTTADLDRHLTTLFPEARLRGYLEVRGVDQLPKRWRGGVVALVVSLLYDDEARHRARRLLEPHRAQLPGLLVRASRAGLADPVLADLAPRVLDLGLEGARRLGIRRADEAMDFLDRYTHQGRHPADDLRAALAEGPAVAFAWASDTPRG